MKLKTQIVNTIDALVAHYAQIFKGSNIHIKGGIGVNEEIAVPRGSFPIKVYGYPNEYSIPEFHKDGTLDVAVYQIAQDRPVLSYELSELVPNSIIQKIKEKNVAWGVGIIARDNEWESSTILNIGEYGKTPIIERREFHRFWGADRSVYQYLWKMGHNANFPYLLVSPDMRVKHAIEQFKAKYHEANRKKLEATKQPIKQKRKRSI